MKAPLDIEPIKQRIGYALYSYTGLAEPTISVIDAEALIGEVERLRAEAIVWRRIVGTDVNLPIHFSQYIPALEAEIGRLRQTMLAEEKP